MSSSTRNRTPDFAAQGQRAEQHLTTGRLGTAQTQWNDYRGTAAADDAIALLGSRSLYEIAGLDRSRWTIVGIDASLPATAEHVTVYARDRSAEPHDREDSSEDLGVTAFHLSSSISVDQFLRDAFQRVSIRLVSTLATDRELRVDNHVELAAQG